MPNDIKISTSLDTASIRNAESAFRGLITLADKLNKSTDRISQSVSKINTGGQTGQANRPGAIKSGPQGQVTGISGAILGDPSQAERAAQRIIAAFDKVESKAQRMASSVKSMGGGGGDAGWSQKAMSSIEGRVVGISDSFSASSGGGTAPSGAPVYGVPSAGGGKGGGGGGSPWGRIGSSGSLSSGAQGVIYGAASGVEALASGNAGGFFGSTIGRLGIIGGAAYAGYRIGDAVTQMGANTYNANQSFQLENPVAIQQKLASAMSPFRNMAHAGIGKSYSSMLAWNRVFHDPEIMNSVTNVRLNQDSINRLMGDNTILGLGKERASDLAKHMTSTGLGIVDWARGEGRAIPDADLKAAREVERRVRQEQLMADEGNRMNSAFEAKSSQMNPYTAMMADEIGQNFMGRFKTLAGAGLRSGIIHKKGRPDMTAYEYYNEKAMRLGWDNGDRGANYQSLLSIGKGYGSILGGFNLLSAGQAGFGSLGGDVRTAGMIGGSVSSANSYLSLINKKNGLTGGPGGLDVAVSNQMFGGISQAALGTGMYGSENLNWVSQNTATMVFGGGVDVAGQQRAAYGFDLGNRQMQTYTSGSRSNLNRAISNEAAMGVAGGFNGISRDLMRMANDPRLLASIAGGAALPEWADPGITRTKAGQFLGRQRAGLFADVMDSTWDTDPVTTKLLSEVRSSGDYNAVINKNLSGLKKGSTDWWKEEHRLNVKLGRALGNDNPQADISMLEEGYLGTLGLKPPKGNGAWRPGLTGPEKEAANQSADIEAAKGVAGPKAWKEAGGQNPADFAGAAVKSMTQMSQMIVSFDEGVTVFKDAVNLFAGKVGYVPPVHAKGPGVVKLPPSSRQM